RAGGRHQPSVPLAGSSPSGRGGLAHPAPPLPRAGPRLLPGGACAPLTPGAGAGRRTAPLPLAPPVPWGGADDPDAAMPANDPAFAADLLHTRLDLHHGLLIGRAGARLLPACCLSGCGLRSWLRRARLLVPVDNASTAQVVGTQLHDHPVIGKDPD